MPRMRSPAWLSTLVCGKCGMSAYGITTGSRMAAANWPSPVPSTMPTSGFTSARAATKARASSISRSRPVVCASSAVTTPPRVSAIAPPPRCRPPRPTSGARPRRRRFGERRPRDPASSATPRPRLRWPGPIREPPSRAPGSPSMPDPPRSCRRGSWALPGSETSRPRPEQGRADPHDGRSLLDGDLEVVRHPHRESRVGVQNASVDSLVPKAPERPERGPRPLGTAVKRAHGHEPRHPERRQGLHAIDEGVRLFRRDPGLRRLVRGADLDVAPKRPALRGRAAGKILGQPERVHGMDRIEELGCTLRLVRLEVADEMPPWTGSHRDDLALGLLDPVLTEIHEVERERAPGDLHPESLRHRQERHRIRF